MAKVITFGELMLRLQPYNYERFVQCDHVEFTYGGGEANVAVSLANYGMDVAYVTKLCVEARQAALGFELAHVGINCADPEEAMAVAEAFNAAFGFSVKEGNSSIFASTGVEVLKSMYLGKNGHIAIRTNSIALALPVLEKAGFEVDMETAKMKGDRINAVYLKNEIGNFAVHLLQK